MVEPWEKFISGHTPENFSTGGTVVRSHLVPFLLIMRIVEDHMCTGCNETYNECVCPAQGVKSCQKELDTVKGRKERKESEGGNENNLERRRREWKTSVYRMS